MEAKSTSRGTVRVALKGVALAMGVAVLVLGILNALPTNAAVSLLGVGLTALALETFF
jgi:hypothetical protein